MIIEVVQDFDGGVVEPGDRGMITSKGRRVMFRTRVPTCGPLALYDWSEDSRWKRVAQSEVEYERYAEQRRHEFYDAVDELRWRGLPDMRSRASRDKLDVHLLVIAGRSPGLRIDQICHFFFALERSTTDRVWKQLQASFRRHIAADRMFDSSRVWLTA
jgi:hypothetical protein